MSAAKQQQQLARTTSWLAQLRVNAEYAMRQSWRKSLNSDSTSRLML
ncbi:MAG: hypothetical protein ACLGJB_03200 [Blastocatellia bacterium]